MIDERFQKCNDDAQCGPVANRLNQMKPRSMALYHYCQNNMMTWNWDPLDDNDKNSFIHIYKFLLYG